MVSAACADGDACIIDVRRERSDERVLADIVRVAWARGLLFASVIQRACVVEGQSGRALEMLELDLPASLRCLGDAKVPQVVPGDALSASTRAGVEAPHFEVVVVNVQLQHPTRDEKRTNKHSEHSHERKHGGHEVLGLLGKGAGGACDVVDAATNGPRVNSREAKNNEVGGRRQWRERKMPVLGGLWWGGHGMGQRSGLSAALTCALSMG